MYDIVLRVVIPENPVEVVNTDVSFSIEIGNTCIEDTLTIVPRGLVQYWIKKPPVVLLDQIRIQQTYSFCPFTCTLQYRNGLVFEPYPVEIINTWNPHTGEYSVFTGDKTLAGQLMFMMIQCVSDLSANQLPVMS